MGESVHNKVSVTPFTISAKCVGYTYQVYISSKKSTFVQDTALTPTNTIAANTLPTSIDIPTTSAEFYSFAFRLKISSTSGNSYYDETTDWQINVNIGVAYIYPQCSDSANGLYMCGDSGQLLEIGNIYTHSNDKTVCFNATAVASLTELQLGAASASLK